MKKIIDLSVHQLVDLSLRSGSIDERVFNQGTLSEGTLIHQYYQKQQKSNYYPEVSLSRIFEYRNLTINLHGRCDGLIKNADGSFSIDEIKTTNADLELFYEQNKNWHLGQAICYAYIYCLNNNLDNISIFLTYISQKNKKTSVKKFSFTISELQQEVEHYLDIYIDFLSIIENLNKEKIISLRNFEFPFSLMRKGQFELISFCKDIIANRQIGFVEAATGLGKTVSTIFSTFDSLINKQNDKIFYLTAKNSGFFQANETFRLFVNKGAKIKVVNILGKEKMCLCEKRKCNPDNCIFAKDYYDKLLNVLKKCLHEENVFDEEYLKKVAWENTICPFELSLDLSLFSDFIVCDYNYCFHPISYLKRFFEAPDKQYNMFFLVDEAHNLVSRSKDMYSSTLTLSSLLSFKKGFKKEKSVSVKKAIKVIEEYFEEFINFDFTKEDGSLVEDILVNNLDEGFVNALKNFDEKFKKFSNDNANFYNEDCEEFSREVFKFLKINDLRNKSFYIYVHKSTEVDLYIKLLCIDASFFIKNILNRTNGAIFFSGTLSPLEYYEKVIIGSNESKKILLRSPFDPNNFNLLINTNTSILYSKRKETINVVIDYINNFIDAKIGNYLVFAPSFEYLRMLKESMPKNKDKKLIFQNRLMSQKEKDSFIKNFKNNPKKTAVGFAVMGGSFSEGIDLANDKLIGVIIIGIGLPSFNFENNLIKEYYDNLSRNGNEFAYINPGMNHVMQAVGRLIRSESDKGSALLIDTRYLNANYRNLFKDEWNNYKRIYSFDELRNILNNFYKN